MLPFDTIFTCCAITFGTQVSPALWAAFRPSSSSSPPVNRSWLGHWWAYFTWLPLPVQLTFSNWNLKYPHITYHIEGSRNDEKCKFLPWRWKQKHGYCQTTIPSTWDSTQKINAIIDPQKKERSNVPYWNVLNSHQPIQHSANFTTYATTRYYHKHLWTSTVTRMYHYVSKLFWIILKIFQRLSCMILSHLLSLAAPSRSPPRCLLRHLWFFFLVFLLLPILPVAALGHVVSARCGIFLGNTWHGYPYQANLHIQMGPHTTNHHQLNGEIKG